MQSIAALNQQMTKDYAERTRALNNAAQRLVARLVGGCWQHDLSRPFTRNGKTYRVCMKCGLSRDFNLSTWETQGASYAHPPASLSN
ncbi:MAG TPA: hypothetical protein VFS77_23120 [Pyrinomonadaceae bacterium]|nr:hypothetical protein [Pyrinomonadaceae bacterium]